VCAFSRSIASSITPLESSRTPSDSEEPSVSFYADYSDQLTDDDEVGHLNRVISAVITVTSDVISAVIMDTSRCYSGY
jgi:hypothetical protein